jgi:hypothetical protein
LIDYPDKKIRISEKPIALEAGFEDIKIKDMSDAEFDITIEGEILTAGIDLGSSTALVIPEGGELATKLLSQYKFTELQTENFTVSGGLQTITEKTGVLPLVKIGNIEFKDLPVKIRKSGRIRVGNDFFKNHQLYIDNQKDVYRVRKVK